MNVRKIAQIEEQVATMISDDEEELSPSSKSIAKPCAVEYCVCSLKNQPEDSELCEGCFYPYHIKCAANRKVIEAYYERYWKPGWQKNYKFYCFICRDFKRSIELYRNDILKSNRAKLLRDFAVEDNFDNKENRNKESEIETKSPVQATSNSVDISSPLSNNKTETNQVKSKPAQKSGVKKLKLKRLRHAQKQPSDQHSEPKKQVLREHVSPKLKKSSSNQGQTSFVQNILKRKIKPTDLCLNVQNKEKSLNQLKKLDKEMNRATNILKTFKNKDNNNRLETKTDQLEANQQRFSISSEDKSKSNMIMAPKKRLLMSFKENSHNYPLIRNSNNVIPNKILLAANL